MVTGTETAATEAITDSCMDEVDLETMKVIQEQFLAVDADEIKEVSEHSKQIKFKSEIVWRNVALFASLHVASLVGLYQFIFVAKWPTLFWYCACWLMGVMGITAGAHRLWSHRSYKAKWPARLGMFFAHMGWLMVRKHPEVKRKGSQLDLSDLFNDPILAFQRRYCSTLHGTWLINSLAHKYGFRPYNPNITPVESLWLAVTAMGEGGHNYHHTFPQDYRTSEYVLHFNVTKLFIDILYFLGLAYDMKVVPQEIIERQKAKYVKKCD
ncbi:unnamed protein product [Acanthocheilonema viteae]|uniref:Fatty acid desaturase domain-containing protein n=1 Tax=Acanthocheilonema viteae TaxID=6277 RepID=A0A498SUZ4_ACAVI|nr:unnamed protein product [Acanthocheilonema viteae]